MAPNLTDDHFLSSSEVQTTGVGVTYLVTSVLVMVSNAIVVIVVVASRELHIPTLWNIAFMALCDFSYGLHYLVFAVPSAFLNRFAYSERFIGISSCLLTMLFGQNVLNVAIAIIDRFIAICWPLKYSQIVRTKNLLIVICITIVLNVGPLCLIIVHDVKYYYDVNTAICSADVDSIQRALVSAGFPAIDVVLFILLLTKVVSVRCRERRYNVFPAHEPVILKFAFTISIAAGVFCLSHAPASVTTIWKVHSGVESVPTGLSQFASVCLLSNSLWNVIIYAATYTPFRNVLLRTFCKHWDRERRQREIRAVYQYQRQLVLFDGIDGI